MNASKFIVIEGMDGCGKDSQLDLLNRHYKKNNLNVHITKEPTSNTIGNLIYDILTKKKFIHSDINIINKYIGHLAIADRYNHIYNKKNGILKYLQCGFDVICSRYYYSTLVYNTKTKEDIFFIKEQNKDILQPDYVFYLKIDIETSLKRISSRNVKDIYETREHLTNIAKKYNEVFDSIKDDDNIFIIDATHDKILVHEEILRIINGKDK